MCHKRNKGTAKIGNRIVKVDKCMALLIVLLNQNPIVKTLSCCCGHGKYPPSIVINLGESKIPLEIISGEPINRKRRFYLKDKDGFYYIPETRKGDN